MIKQFLKIILTYIEGPVVSSQLLYTLLQRSVYLFFQSLFVQLARFYHNEKKQLFNKCSSFEKKMGLEVAT